MTAVETQELSTHLRKAAEDVTPRPGFAAAVVRGGQRRQVRRRIGVGTAVVAAIALASGGTYAVVTNDTVTTNEIMAGWLEGPTKGDLAGDQRLLGEATTAWRDGQSRSPNASAGVFDDLRGEPHVYWAGDTPAGPAAVVVQQAYLHPHEQLPSGARDTLQTLVGLAATDPKDGEFKLVSDQFQARPGDALPGYFLFGEKDTVLLVIDGGQAVWQSPGGERWDRVPISDGVGVAEFEPTTIPRFLVSGTDPRLDSAVDMPLHLASDYVAAAKAGGTGPLRPADEPVLGWGENWTLGSDVGGEFDAHELFVRAYSAEGDVSVDDAGQTVVRHQDGSTIRIDNWTIRTGFSNGKVQVLGAVKHDDEPWALYAIYVNAGQPEVMTGGQVINHSAPLPVVQPVSAEDGWVVAAKDRPLSYRTDGEWQPAGTSAALVPWNTTQVKVGDTVVDIR
jgi:hypothetical protein